MIDGAELKATGRWLRYQTRPEQVRARRMREVTTIKTADGVILVGRGDYVIEGADGTIWSCDPATFAKTYEPKIS